MSRMSQASLMVQTNQSEQDSPDEPDAKGTGQSQEAQDT